MIATGYETQVPLTQEWLAKVGDKVLAPDEHLSFELEIVRPEGDAEKALHMALMGETRNLYQVKSVTVGPNPFAAFS